MRSLPAHTEASQWHSVPVSWGYHDDDFWVDCPQLGYAAGTVLITKLVLFCGKAIVSGHQRLHLAGWLGRRFERSWRGTGSLGGHWTLEQGMRLCRCQGLSWILLYRLALLLGRTHRAS